MEGKTYKYEQGREDLPEVYLVNTKKNPKQNTCNQQIIEYMGRYQNIESEVYNLTQLEIKNLPKEFI